MDRTIYECEESDYNVRSISPSELQVVLEPADRIQCRICGKRLKALNVSHLKKHGISPQEYKEKFGETYLYSSGSRRTISRNRKKTDSQNQYVAREKEEIINDIFKLARGGAISYSDLKIMNPALLKQAEYIFGNWEKISKAVGMKFKGQINWNPLMILKEIHKRKEAGQSVTYSDVRGEFPALVSAAGRYFQTWKNAVALESKMFPQHSFV